MAGMSNKRSFLPVKNEGDDIRGDVSTNSTELSFSDFLIIAFLQDRGAQNLELFERPPSFLL